MSTNQVLKLACIPLVPSANIETERDNTARITIMSEKNDPEIHSAMNSHETNKNEKPEIRTLTEKVDKQIKKIIPPPTRQLKDLTRLVQEFPVASLPIYYTGLMSTQVVPRMNTRPTTSESIILTGPFSQFFFSLFEASKKAIEQDRSELRSFDQKFYQPNKSSLSEFL